MADASQAPTLEKSALPTDGRPSAPAAVDQGRLQAAIRYGWALEELVYRLVDWAAHLADQTSGSTAESDFPPDLSHQRSSAEYIRTLRAGLKADGLKVVDAAPASALVVDTALDNLLKAYEANQPLAAFLTGSQRITASAHLWDADVVDLIIDQPAEVLAAYELGKALSNTQWQLRLAQAAPKADPPADPLATAWYTQVNKTRIGEIRDRLTALALALDPQTVASVSASMGFWWRAYELGYLSRVDSPAARKSTDPPPDPTSLIPKDAQGRADAQAALEDQLTNWSDLLTGRRRLDSFPVTGVVSNIMRQYTQREWIQWLPTVGIVAGGLLAVVVLAVVIWAVFGGNATTAGFTGGLATLLGFFVARGAGLLDRGSQTVQDLQMRVGQIQAQLSSLAASAADQPPQLTFDSLASSVLAQVVAQIRLEESKLAISQPLIEFVMHKDIATKGPEEIASDFLSKILQNDGRSNLDRLQDVLTGLYQGYQPLLPGGR